MSLGEHVYIAFRLGGIMSKLKTKWLLSKTSAFIVAFLFQGKRAHMLASAVKAACLIQVNLVNSPSPCLVQRNEAFCPGSVLAWCQVPVAGRGFPAPCSPVPWYFPGVPRLPSVPPGYLLLHGLQLPCCSGSIHSLQVVLVKCSI